MTIHHPLLDPNPPSCWHILGAIAFDFHVPEYLCFMAIRFTTVVLLLGAFSMVEAAAQTENPSSNQDGWWHDLFRADSASRTGETFCKDDSTFWDLPSAEVRFVMPDTLKVLDSLDKANPRPVQGHRIQIYFGTCRKPGPSAPNSAGTPRHPLPTDAHRPQLRGDCGQLRDVWSARRAWKKECRRLETRLGHPQQHRFAGASLNVTSTIE